MDKNAHRVRVSNEDDLFKVLTDFGILSHEYIKSQKEKNENTSDEENNDDK